MIHVIGSIFAGTGKSGDFAWMIRQPEYADALFVFNDNEEQFRAHWDDPDGAFGALRAAATRSSARINARTRHRRLAFRPARTAEVTTH